MEKPPYTRRELVVSALLRGKIQQQRYQTHRGDVEVSGTVAVVRRGECFLAGIRELHDVEKQWAADNFDYDRFLDKGYDVDEQHELPDLAAVERLFAARLPLRLEDLGPARGTRFRFSEAQ